MGRQYTTNFFGQRRRITYNYIRVLTCFRREGNKNSFKSRPRAEPMYHERNKRAHPPLHRFKMWYYFNRKLNKLEREHRGAGVKQNEEVGPESR